MIEAQVLAEARSGVRRPRRPRVGGDPHRRAQRRLHHLKRYEVERLKKHKNSTLDQARDRYAVGLGVGLLVLEERNRKLEREGKKRPDDTVVERQAIARAALALMPDFDKLALEAGLEPRVRPRRIDSR